MRLEQDQVREIMSALPVGQLVWFSSCSPDTPVVGVPVRSMDHWAMVLERVGPCSLRQVWTASHDRPWERMCETYQLRGGYVTPLTPEQFDAFRLLVEIIPADVTICHVLGGSDRR